MKSRRSGFTVKLILLTIGAYILSFSQHAQAQGTTVTGTVSYNPTMNDCLQEAPCTGDVELTNEEDWVPPKAAVNIVVKSTGQVVKTDPEGRYEATVAARDDTLMVLYIGHNRVEVPINGRRVVDVKLTPMPLPVVERLMEQIMPDLDMGQHPDIDALAEKAEVNRETARDILWLILGNRPFAEAYPEEYIPDYRFD